MNRLEANLRLLAELEILIYKQVDQRFSQLLQNYGFIKPQRPVQEPGEQTWQNEFYLEPVELLKRVKQSIKNIEDQP